MIKHALLDLNMEISNYGQMYASSFLFWYDALRIIKMISIVLMQLQHLSLHSGQRWWPKVSYCENINHHYSNDTFLNISVLMVASNFKGALEKNR